MRHTRLAGGLRALLRDEATYRRDTYRDHLVWLASRLETHPTDETLLAVALAVWTSLGLAVERRGATFELVGLYREDCGEPSRALAEAMA